MVIERIDVYWVRVPLAFVWRTSYADQHDTDTIVVRMESEGHHAWGESCPPFIPAYSADHTLATYHTVCEHLAPRLIGQDVGSAQDLLDRIDFVKGNQFARAALEIAWWVLEAKRRGVPVARGAGRQGGYRRGRRRLRRAGLARRPDAEDPGRDRSRASRASSSSSGRAGISTWSRPSGPRFRTLTFHIDCNAAYTPADTDLFRRLDRYRLAMIEQPLADDGMSLVNHADLQARLETPVCLDESAISLAARRGRDPAGRLPRGERQDGSRRWPGGVASHPGAVRGARDSVLDRRDARDGHRRRDLRRAGHTAQLHLSRVTSSRRRTSTPTISASPRSCSAAGARSRPHACPASRRPPIPTCSRAGPWRRPPFARSRRAQAESTARRPPGCARSGRR